MAAAVAAMDFRGLSRRELALCKRNGVPANMTNAAMAEALQSLLPLVDGIDEIGRSTAPPGMPATETPADEVVREEERHGCPLPRGGRTRATTRRSAAHTTEVVAAAPEQAQEVSQVKRKMRRSSRSKAVNAMGQELEVAAVAQKGQKGDSSDAAIGSAVVAHKSCDDQVVAVVGGKTTKLHERIVDELEPGMPAMESPSVEVVREEERHGCPIPHSGRTRARTTRSAAHKTELAAPAPEQVEEVSKAKRKTRRFSRSKAMKTLNQKEDVASTAQKELKVSYKSCDDLKEEKVVAVVEEKATKPQEGIVEEHEPITTGVQKSASLVILEDSPTPSVMPKAKAAEPIIEMAQDASVGDSEGFVEWLPAKEITDEISHVLEKKVVVCVEEVFKEDGFTQWEG